MAAIECNDPEAFSDEFEDFNQALAEEQEEEQAMRDTWDEQPEDAHLEAAYEDRFYMYDQDLLEREDFGCYDNDPNPYEGTYSED